MYMRTRMSYMYINYIIYIIYTYAHARLCLCVCIKKPNTYGARSNYLPKSARCVNMYTSRVYISTTFHPPSRRPVIFKFFYTLYSWCWRAYIIQFSRVLVWPPSHTHTHTHTYYPPSRTQLYYKYYCTTCRHTHTQARGPDCVGLRLVSTHVYIKTYIYIIPSILA